MNPSDWTLVDYLLTIVIGLCFGIGLWLSRVLEAALKRG